MPCMLGSSLQRKLSENIGVCGSFEYRAAVTSSCYNARNLSKPTGSETLPGMVHLFDIYSPPDSGSSGGHDTTLTKPREILATLRSILVRLVRSAHCGIRVGSILRWTL